MELDCDLVNSNDMTCVVTEPESAEGGGGAEMGNLEDAGSGDCA